MGHFHNCDPQPLMTISEAAGDTGWRSCQTAVINRDSIASETLSHSCHCRQVLRPHDTTARCPWRHRRVPS